MRVEVDAAIIVGNAVASDGVIAGTAEDDAQTVVVGVVVLKSVIARRP
ncbi:MAG: hypothetical protein GWP10_19665 [Nitrospiraceae bacterium]|nr:hypothetical protein [Nitrospiraceae bacterium]